MYTNKKANVINVTFHFVKCTMLKAALFSSTRFPKLTLQQRKAFN